MKGESILIGSEMRLPCRPPVPGKRFVFAAVSFVVLVLAGIGLVVSHAGIGAAPRSTRSAGSQSPTQAPVQWPNPRSSFDNLMYTSPPLETLVESASAGDACAQEILGFALLDAAQRPESSILIPDALYWLERAHGRGSPRAAEGLLRFVARHCDDPRVRDQAVCRTGE